MNNGNGLITYSQITKINRNVYFSDGETSIFWVPIVPERVGAL